MKHGLKRKIGVLSEASILLFLAFFSVSVATAAPPELPNVQITSLEAYELSPRFYDIDFTIHNYETYNVTVEINHTLVYPNGNNHSFLMGPWVVEPDETAGANIFCLYPTRLCGIYTWVVTLKDTSGNILDEDSVSWFRESFLEKQAIPF
jgi:hypothetical protein